MIRKAKQKAKIAETQTNLAYAEERKNQVEEDDDFMITTDQLGAMTDPYEVEEVCVDIVGTAYQVMKTKDSIYGIV